MIEKERERERKRERAREREKRFLIYNTALRAVNQSHDHFGNHTDDNGLAKSKFERSPLEAYVSPCVIQKAAVFD